jgi:hypothetical protein
MTDDAGHEGQELVTGFTGESFWVDKDGKPIPNEPHDEAPTELPSASDIWDTLDKPAPSGDSGGGLGLGGGLGDLMPTGILPGDSGQIGGNDDETQKEIWRQMERGDFGTDAGSGSIPEDAETSI